jgi:F-type H+-transporting ATPase subunit c
MGSIGKAALESMARQPELSGKTFTTMLIAMALVEALAIYCLLIALVILYANPMLG